MEQSAASAQAWATGDVYVLVSRKLEKPYDGMYLSRLCIKNFRSCYDAEVEFQPNITLLVGENNSGKSNVIEALRLAITPLNRRATRWFDESDLSHGREAEEAQFRVSYDALTSAQRAQNLGRQSRQIYSPLKAHLALAC
ncbi:ATP-dependent nuclease [Streptomyces lydicus]|uniref:ATP-dependent nuclease n=1 Tax=Streptomyces lydicus TaxID=47763 RepID=UPI00378D3542